MENWKEELRTTEEAVARRRRADGLTDCGDGVYLRTFPDVSPDACEAFARTLSAPAPAGAFWEREVCGNRLFCLERESGYSYACSVRRRAGRFRHSSASARHMRAGSG